MELDSTVVKKTSLLKTMVLNAQDLFLFMDKHDQTSLEDLTETKWQLMSSSLFFNKSKDKCLALAPANLTIENLQLPRSYALYVSCE